MSGAKIKAIDAWLGGKRTLASTIVEELGPHRAYWEPFCGSMAVLFAKPPSQQETVCDLHGGLINLARVLADPQLVPELYRRARQTLSCDALYWDSRAWLDANTEAVGLEAAYHYLVTSWQGRNGTGGTPRRNYKPSMRFTPGGGSGAVRWRSAVESIPSWCERLRNVTILRVDAFEVIPKIADELGVVIYADPPYFRSTRGAGRGSVYLHDFTPRDHVWLFRWLQRFRRARVVVSYYDSPQVRKLYDGWTVRKCTIHKRLVNQNHRGRTGRVDAPEILLINGPSYAAQEPTLFDK